MSNAILTYTMGIPTRCQSRIIQSLAQLFSEARQCDTSSQVSEAPGGTTRKNQKGGNLNPKQQWGTSKRLHTKEKAMHEQQFLSGSILVCYAEASSIC